MEGYRIRCSVDTNTRRAALGLSVLLALGTVLAALAFVPPASGLTWTQTSAADFAGGQGSNVEVLPSGDLQLAGSSTWSRIGMVLDIGPGGSYDDTNVRAPSVLWDGGMYRMWYTANGDRLRTLYATSMDGVGWTKQGLAVDVLQAPYNFDLIAGSSVILEGGTYKMWFSGGWWTGGPFSTLNAKIYYATSTDAVSWSIQGVALDLGAVGTWDDHGLEWPSVVRNGTGPYYLFYDGWTTGNVARIGAATSSDGRTFTRPTSAPVLDVGPAWAWDRSGLLSAVALPGSPWRIWYTGGDTTANRIGLATSPDGITMTKSLLNPILTEGPAGSCDNIGLTHPNVVSDGTTLRMYYAGVTGAGLRICLARSVTSYSASGWYESAVLDAGAPGAVWNTLSTNATAPASTTITFRTRTGDVPTPDGSWSAWSGPAPPGMSPISSPRARYLQMRADLTTTNSSRTPVLHEFTVDYSLNSASAPTPLSPVGGAWTNTSGVRVTWTYADPEGDPQAGFRAQVSGRADFATIEADSNPVLSSDTFWRTPPIADGGWYWRVQTVDTFGAWSPYSTPAYVQIDTAPPVTTLSFAAPPDIVNGIPRLASSNRVILAATDVGSGGTTTRYSVNLGPPATYNVPFLPAAHGLVNLEYWSVDAAGNRETPNNATLLVDEAPAVTPTSPASGTWTNSSTVTLGWTYADPDGDAASGYEVELATDSAFAAIAFTSGQVPGAATRHTFPAVADGTYFWRVRAADAYGAWSPFSTARTVSVDTRLPTAYSSFSGIVREGPDRQIWVLPGAMLNLTATDTGSGIAQILYTIDGPQVTHTYTTEVAVTHGSHLLAYWAVDNAGNVGPVKFVTFLVDQEPDASNGAPADASWATTPLRLNWKFTDADGDTPGGYEVQVASDASFATITATSGTVGSTDREWQLPALPDGDYYWRVRVQDSFGIWSSWSSSTRVRIDATAPATNALHGGSTIPASSGLFGLSVGDSIALNATDAGSGVARIEYSLDGSPWTNYSAPIVFDAEGRHVLAFRAVDNVGNVGTTRLLVVDATYPFNWTPVLALTLAFVIALVGALLVFRRKDPSAKPPKALAWAAMAGPGTILEIVVGIYSLVSGELATPPWLGPGLVAVIAIGVVGFIFLVIGRKALSGLGAAPTEEA